DARSCRAARASRCSRPSRSCDRRGARGPFPRGPGRPFDQRDVPPRRTPPASPVALGSSRLVVSGLPSDTPNREEVQMSAQEDAELVRRGYDAFIAGDMEWMNEHLHENIVWHVPGDNRFSGDHRGREAVLALFANLVSVVVPEFDIHDVVASDDHVVVLS